MPTLYVLACTTLMLAAIVATVHAAGLGPGPTARHWRHHQHTGRTPTR